MVRFPKLCKPNMKMKWEEAHIFVYLLLTGTHYPYYRRTWNRLGIWGRCLCCVQNPSSLKTSVKLDSEFLLFPSTVFFIGDRKGSNLVSNISRDFL